MKCHCVIHTLTQHDLLDHPERIVSDTRWHQWHIEKTAQAIGVSVYSEKLCEPKASVIMFNDTSMTLMTHRLVGGLSWGPGARGLSPAADSFVYLRRREGGVGVSHEGVGITLAPPKVFKSTFWKSFRSWSKLNTSRGSRTQNLTGFESIFSMVGRGSILCQDGGMYLAWITHADYHQFGDGEVLLHEAWFWHYWTLPKCWNCRWIAKKTEKKYAAKKQTEKV